MRGQHFRKCQDDRRGNPLDPWPDWSALRRPAIRTPHGWAISVLQRADAIRECEEHGWIQDRTNPYARERAFEIAR